MIDAGRGESKPIQSLQRIAKTSSVAVSVITHMELLVGCRNKSEQQKLEAFLASFTILNLSDQISRIAIGLLRRYRLSHGLLIPDAIIAATALESNSPLISKNQRDYKFIQGLNLLQY